MIENSVIDVQLCFKSLYETEIFIFYIVTFHGWDTNPVQVYPIILPV